MGRRLVEGVEREEGKGIGENATEAGLRYRDREKSKLLNQFKKQEDMVGTEEEVHGFINYSWSVRTVQTNAQQAPLMVYERSRSGSALLCNRFASTKLVLITIYWVI